MTAGFSRGPRRVRFWLAGVEARSWLAGVGRVGDGGRAPRQFFAAGIRLAQLARAALAVFDQAFRMPGYIPSVTEFPLRSIVQIRDLPHLVFHFRGCVFAGILNIIQNLRQPHPLLVRY